MLFVIPRSRLLGTLLPGLLLGTLGRPLERYSVLVGGNELGARQQSPSNTAVMSPVTVAPLPSSSIRSRTEAATRSELTATSSLASVTPPSTSATTTTLASPSQNLSSTTTTRVPTTSNGVSSSPSSTSASTTATATSVSRSNNIFSKDSPYYSYAIAVTVVVAIFSFLLLVLVVRFIVQCFARKPKSELSKNNLGAGARRYSEDSNYNSARRLPASANATETTPDMRHKDLPADVSERRGFLSTEDVALYAPGNLSNNQPSRYNDEEPAYPNRTRSFSGSSGSGSQTAVPSVSRRPASMSFLHSPSATHPAFIIHPGSESGHSEEVQGQLKSVPEESAVMPNKTSTLLLARANHSNPYRQQTLASGVTDLSRAASTASAYSQLSTYSAVPPVPQLPSQYTRPTQPQLSPDISAALLSMRGYRNSMDSAEIDTIKTTAPPTEEGTAAPSAAVARSQPGRAGWAGRAPSSIHGPDIYFGH